LLSIVAASGLNLTFQYILNGCCFCTLKPFPSQSSSVTADRDEDSGKFTEQYPREEFLQAVNTLNNATTARIADEVGCSYDLAYRRLKDLEKEGDVTQTEIGSSFVWSQ
jgi:hypothetical protein